MLLAVFNTVCPTLDAWEELVIASIYAWSAEARIGDRFPILRNIGPIALCVMYPTVVTEAPRHNTSWPTNK